MRPQKSDDPAIAPAPLFDAFHRNRPGPIAHARRLNRVADREVEARKQRAPTQETTVTVPSIMRVP